MDDDGTTEESSTDEEEEESWADSMSSPPPGSANASEPASPAAAFHSPPNNFPLDPLVQQLERVQLRMEEEEAEAGWLLRTMSPSNALRCTTYLLGGC